MKMDELDSFLATVDEFVDDENRIVTYKWLSQQLAIPVGKAKSLLQNYAESCKKRNNEIHIVYAIIGHDSAGMSVKVVRDVDLESAKSKMENIYSVSLYSVQKMKLQDSSILYATDYDTNQKNLAGISKMGGITYNGAKCLSKDEIKQQKQTPSGAKEISADLAKQFAKPTSDKGKPAQQKVNFFAKTRTSPNKKTIKEEPSTKNDFETRKSDSKKDDSPPIAKKQKKGVEAFMSKDKSDPFAKSKGVKSSTKEEKSSENDENEKQLSKNNEKIVKKDKVVKTVEKDEKKSPKNKSSSKRSFEDDDLKIDDFPDDDDFVEKSDQKPKSSKNVTGKVSKANTVEKPQKKPTKGKKNSRHDSNNLPAKKRRRIQELSSSSSEDEEDENEEMPEEMDIPPPSPPPVLELKPEPLVEEKKTADNSSVNKIRKKVMKSRTFVDDDGCMVTEKYYDFEEVDAPEPVANGNSAQAEQKQKNVNTETESKKKKPPALSTAAQPKKQQKQASIMGFFKKKS